MAYTPGKTWQHGDFPLAADFNAIKASLDAIYAQTGAAEVNGAVCFRRSGVQSFYFVHKHPYLIYLIQAPDTTGRIEDPAGVEDDVTLPVESGWTYYDLGAVDWLYPGKVYQVEGVTTCFEDATSL